MRKYLLKSFKMSLMRERIVMVMMTMKMMNKRTNTMININRAILIMTAIINSKKSKL